MPSITDLMNEFYNNRDQESLVVRGSAVAPAAGVAVATIAAPPAGVYEITAIARYGATADVVDNMELKINGASVLTLPVLPVINGAPQPITITRKLSGSQAITVNAVAIGGAGSVFIAHIIATKVGDL